MKIMKLICQHCGNEQEVSNTELATSNYYDDKDKHWHSIEYHFHCNKCLKYEKNTLTVNGNWAAFPRINDFKKYEFNFCKGVIIHDRDQDGCLLNFEYFRKVEKFLP